MENSQPASVTNATDKKVDLKKAAEVPVSEPMTKKVSDEDGFEYKLGRRQFKDSTGGDMGGLCKTATITPKVFFVKAAFCAKANAQNRHPEMQHLGK